MNEQVEPGLPERRVLLRLLLTGDDLDPILESESPHRPATLDVHPIDLD
jgi:hypothetical protein